MEHTKDADCTVDPKTDLCAECGVYHGDPCIDCGGRGFHKQECSRGDEGAPRGWGK